MAQLIRIIYISRSTFKSSKSNSAIEPNVGRILTQSRINNKHNGLVGVLYFGDGCFFQCLEGEDSAVDALYTRLQVDPRHKDIKLLSREPIRALSYEEWAMKFVPLDMQMTQLMREGGLERFDPYRFDKQMVDKVMSLLGQSTSQTTAAEVEKLISQSIAEPTDEKSVMPLWLIAALLVMAAVAAGILFLR
jgi:hypothetical protein